MRKSIDLLLKRDLTKLACLTIAVTSTAAVFILTPALSTPTLLSIVVATLLSPSVAALERRGYPRAWAITLIFFLLFLAFAIFGFWGVQAGVAEWNSLEQKAPEHFRNLIDKATLLEGEWQSRYPFLNTVHPTRSVLNWWQQTWQWFVEHGPELMGEILTWILTVPPLSFVLLNEGRLIRMRFFQLVPNRYFESFFLVTNKISRSISDYVRAKLVEALLVGLLVTLGLMLVKAPYVVVLGMFAGVTNIVPYVGPFLGAIPGIFAVTLDPHSTRLILSVSTVYIIANVIDTVVIFPLVVAKLVKLHPLLLIAVVVIGQRYYGLVGMLICIPIAASVKVVVQEIYYAVYDHPSLRDMALPETHFETASEKPPHSDDDSKKHASSHL